jgi:hypothetical protein
LSASNIKSAALPLTSAATDEDDFVGDDAQFAAFRGEGISRTALPALDQRHGLEPAAVRRSGFQPGLLPLLCNIFDRLGLSFGAGFAALKFVAGEYFDMATQIGFGHAFRRHRRGSQKSEADYSCTGNKTHDIRLRLVRSAVTHRMSGTLYRQFRFLYMHRFNHATLKTLRPASARRN